jgi:CBS domain-containing protein
MMAETMTAGDICNRSVVVALRDTALQEAAQRMREHHVGCLVVVDTLGAQRKIAGMLTDRDIVAAVIAKGVDPQRLLVEDVMSVDVVTVKESDSFAGLLATMRREGLRRLPVTSSAGGFLVGLVSLDDLLEILADQMQTVVQAIQTEQRRERAVRR